MSGGWKLYWLLVAVTLSLYATMIFWSLPFISQAADGLRPFDMRPMGYSFGEAHEFLSALSGDGVRFYQSTQHRLDTAYPALLALILIIPLRWFTAAWPVLARVPLIALPLIGAAADYLENATVAKMLLAQVAQVTPDLVAIASGWTLVKSATTSVSMAALLVLLLVGAARRLKKPNPSA